ncbi:unnamed protein product [Polarella glacialis]|uniref:Uncharacterized protein n=1 Tax=Polarella glacialis TaxID=89957 RepID=A0A813KCE1_POLGL|nr:unnamed protein product [Polarella glacialis]
MASQPMCTGSLAAIVILTLVVLALLVWIWGEYLDRHEHDPGRIRAVMFLFLWGITAFDIGMSTSGITCPAVASLSLLVNIWGGLDALLRFPAAHELESFFSVKQFCLLSLKTFGYAFGFSSFREHIGKFIVVLLLNIWAPPVLYLMALPLDPFEQVVKDDEYDVDLAFRVWHLATCSSERRRCVETCRCWWNRHLLAASERSSLARIVVCAASPGYRRTFCKKGRSV